MFEVGQRVVIQTQYGYGSIGTVLRITEKQKSVVVKFPGCKPVNYDLDGWEKGYSSARKNTHLTKIIPMTADVAKEIGHLTSVSRCFTELSNSLFKYPVRRYKRLYRLLW